MTAPASSAADAPTGQPQTPRAGEVQVRNLFPTPVATFLHPRAVALNAALVERILARERAVASVHHSNWGGWQSPADFETWGGPEGLEVLETARGLAARLTADRSGRPYAGGWRTNAWANVNRHGQGNEFHTHPGAYWSATYYVADGGIAADPSLGGEFEMQDPRGVAPAMLAPMLAFATGNGLSVGAAETIRPRAGMLVLFPSWLSHGVRPYAGAAVRISIALNLTPA